MILKIRKDIDPILREPTEKVVDFGHEFQLFIDSMIETMRKNNGIGLAAPQVGKSIKVFICEFAGEEGIDLPKFPLTVICNPEIVSKSKKIRRMVEGCLSFPGLELLIRRPEKVTVRGQDRFGNDIEITAEDLYARVIQHENDHLNSTLMIDKLEEIKVIFIGTGSMGANALKMMSLDPQYKIQFVITGNEKEVQGRKKNDTINPIVEIAKKYKIPIHRTNKIRADEKLINEIIKAKPDLGVIADFGQIIPKEIIDIFKHGILNIHPSLLPKHRGSSPIQSTILNGDPEAGITIIAINEKMDAGGIISQVTVSLSQSETATTLKDYLAEIGGSLLLNSIPYYIAGDLKPVPQNEEFATFTKIIKKEDGLVDLCTDKFTVDRKIRAFNDWPKAYIMIKNKRVQLLSAHFEEDGEFVIDVVKPEGKKEMSYQDFMHGYKTKLTFK